MKLLTYVFKRGSVCFPVLLALGCHHGRPTRFTPPVPPDSFPVPTDSIAVVSVNQPGEPGGISLKSGNPAVWNVKVQYTLTTVERARLSLSLDQFADRTGCTGSDVQTPAVKTVPITRGTHELEIPITWPGDTGAGTNGRVYGAGAVSIRISLSTERPDYQFLTRRFGTEICMQF